MHVENSMFLFYKHIECIVHRDFGKNLHEEEEEVEEEEMDSEDDDVDNICEATSIEFNPSSASMSSTEDDDVHRRPKKRGLTLESFGYKMEQSMENLAQSMKSIDNTKPDKMKNLLDT